MTTFVGTHQVVAVSSAQETFAMVIESAEYAQMQSNFFDVLWGSARMQTSTSRGTRSPYLGGPYAIANGVDGLSTSLAGARVAVSRFGFRRVAL